jgi:uncharacterized protein (TIGR03032 family)
LERRDRPSAVDDTRPLVPVRSVVLPGALYIHDLAYIGKRLHANAVGENAVVRVSWEGACTRVWWPRSIEHDGAPDHTRNYLQLNSIAAGSALRSSFFSASAASPSNRRPGQLGFPVDGRGVIFSGRTREVVARGLTRPHSARLHDRALWVDNSGYGEVGVVESGRFEALARLPGWTRGLGFHRDVAFVGVSRVIPRFRRYAPGLDTSKSRCGVVALDARTGTTLASVEWPRGNQIFAVEPLRAAVTQALPFRAKQSAARERALFYGFRTKETNNDV